MSTQLTTTQPETLSSFTTLQDWSVMVIENVRHLSDTELIEHGRSAEELVKASFRIRGAIGAELKRRYWRALAEQGRADEANIQTLLSRAAKDMNISPKTLDDDCRIYECFEDDLRVDADLDREFWRFALAAPDPQAAIEMARGKKAENSSYSVLNFRDDVWELRGGKPIKGVDKTGWINEKLESPEAVAAWAKITHHFASNSEALSVAVIKLAGELS